MSEKLLPCPFCGDFDAECAESAVPNVHGGQKYAVFCNACFCEGPTDDIRERAIAAWNRRELESASQPGGGEAEFMLQLLELAGHITPELIAKARHLARLACAATGAGNGGAEGV